MIGGDNETVSALVLAMNGWLQSIQYDEVEIESIEQVQEMAIVGIGIFIFALAISDCKVRDNKFSRADVDELCEVLCDAILSVTKDIKIEKGH